MTDRYVVTFGTMAVLVDAPTPGAAAAAVLRKLRMVGGTYRSASGADLLVTKAPDDQGVFPSRKVKDGRRPQVVSV